MPFERLIRLGGLTLILTAIIQGVATIFDGDLGVDSNAIGSPAWIPSHLAFSVAYTLALPGLVALYLRQAERLGRLGEIGILLALFGSALTASVSMLVGAALPVIAPHAPGFTRSLAFLDTGGPLHFMQPAVVLTALTYFPGFILTGIATMRAGLLPRWPALALAIGALGTLGALAGPGAIARSITIGGSMFLGVGFAWLGYELLADSAASMVARGVSASSIVR